MYIDYCSNCGHEHGYMSLHECESCGGNTFRRTPLKEAQCFVVAGDCGAYSDKETWMVRAFTSEHEANEFLNLLITTESIQEHDPRWSGLAPSSDVIYSVCEIPLGTVDILPTVVVRDIQLEDVSLDMLSVTLRANVPRFYHVRRGYGPPDRQSRLEFTMESDPDRKPKRKRRPEVRVILHGQGHRHLGHKLNAVF